MQSRAAVSGERSANSQQALIAELKKEGIAPSSILEKKGEKSQLFAPRKKKVTRRDIALFTRQFAVMLGAGLPLVQALGAIAHQNPNDSLRDILEQIKSDVESGTTLAKAMEKHPKAFDTLYTNMIAAGESGGILDAILQRLSVYIEKMVKLRGDLKKALVYPAAILSIAVIVITIILWKVVPTFRTMFEGFSVELPLPTRIVIAASSAVETFILPIVVVVALGVFGFKKYYATNNGRHFVDKMVLKMPVLGDVIRKICIARFVSTLATLMSSGVPILECLDITAKTAGNAILEDVVFVVRKRIEEGGTMADPMRQSNFFPAMATQMVAVGESTGEVDTMLVKVSDYYESEVDAVMANLLTLMEPILMSFLGIIVGGIVIAMYLPLFKLISTLSGG